MPDDGFVNGEWAAESADHVALKNTAVMFLMSLGFEKEQIREEVQFGKQSVDILAEESDGSYVMVECETKPDKVPPEPHDVTYNKEQYNDGHQLFALTEHGLFELVDKRAMVFFPVEDVQTTLQPSERTHIGRWAADGREKEELPQFVPLHRRHADTFDKRGLSESMIADNHERWRANGKEPSAIQPTIYEMAGERNETSGTAPNQEDQS